MDSLTHQQFDTTVRQVLQDYNISDIEEKLKNELHDLFFISDHIGAYKAWITSNHIYSYFPRKVTATKNINLFIKSQISHLDEVMKLCKFQYNGMKTYYHLNAISLALNIFLIDKEILINLLCDLNFAYWTQPQDYQNPFSMIQNAFDEILDIEDFFHEGNIDYSPFKEDFARSFLNMRTFFDALNITEKRIQTSFSICTYQILTNLKLSKYKTKEITDTIMHHLDIKTSINLKKIDSIHYIGEVWIHRIYCYDSPTIPAKLLDRKFIQDIQKQKKQIALENNDFDLTATLDEMMQRMNIVMSV